MKIADARVFCTTVDAGTHWVFLVLTTEEGLSGYGEALLGGEEPLLIDALQQIGILEKADNGEVAKRPRSGSEKAYQLMMLGQSMVPMLQRFYLVIAVLVGNGSGTLSRARLETMCQQSAERLSMIYGLHSPDFFNKALFQDYIRKLQDGKVIRKNEQGNLEYDETLTGIGADARLVLGEEIRHSILSLTAAGGDGSV